MSQISSLSLDDRIRQAVELIPPAHCVAPINDEIFSLLEEGKPRLQNYAFTQGFALASTSFQKGKTVLVLDCTRHGKRLEIPGILKMKIDFNKATKFFLTTADIDCD